MSARTTPDLVKGIIETEDDKDLSPFIDTAHELVDQVCLTSGYSAELLELIERWLAAHFYTMFDNQLLATKAGTVNVSFQNKIGMALNASMYGQQAMLIDTAGNLAGLNNTIALKKRFKISAAWLGSNECLYYPYPPCYP